MPSLRLTALALILLASTAHAESVVVRKGDTLGGIARKFRCDLKELRAANPSLRGDTITLGQTLEIPDSCGQTATRPTRSRPRGRITHEVMFGETLEQIADHYELDVSDLRRDNARLLKRGLKAGAKLRIASDDKSLAQRRTTYTVAAGDTLASIAQHFGITPQDLQRLNPRVSPRKLKVGARLKVLEALQASPSQSVGRPYAGRLVDGQQLKPMPGIWIKNSTAAWGTDETVRWLKTAIKDVRRQYPQVHDLTIGDLSLRNGGFRAPHRSHQSGLDVDIGFYYRGQKRQGPRASLDATVVGLDFAPTWALIEALIGPSREKTHVAAMFIGYPVQEKIYKWAKSNGISTSLLDWYFQYPRGSAANAGIIRHEPGHMNHIHIRFKCPPSDKECHL